MKFGKIPKEKRKFICDKLIPEPYLSRTCSVHSSLRSTSGRRNYGFDTEQVHLGYSVCKNKTCLYNICVRGIAGYATNTFLPRLFYKMIFSFYRKLHISATFEWLDSAC